MFRCHWTVSFLVSTHAAGFLWSLVLFPDLSGSVLTFLNWGKTFNLQTFCPSYSCEHRWFSGRMLACHAGGPGSIPGRCKFLWFFFGKHVGGSSNDIFKWYFIPTFPYLWGSIQVTGCSKCKQNRGPTCVMFPPQCHLPDRLSNCCPAQKQDQLIGCSCCTIHNIFCLNNSICCPLSIV